jgi:hypothetical protein
VRRLLLSALLTLIASGAARAQRLAVAPERVQPAALEARHAAGAFPDEGVGQPWQRVAASLLVPGTGQLMAHQPRGIVYLAVEIWAVTRAMALDDRGDDRARQYRDLAYEVARRSFTPVRVDGPFEYYETMGKYVESGVYDTDPGAAFVPESDARTYNGSVWLTARRTYFLDPDSIPPVDSPAYAAALAFYQERAATDQFRWSWRNARLEQDVFATQIHASDVAFQQRTNYLGLLVLNHLASAMDALVSARLGRGAGMAPRLSFPGPGSGDLGVTWKATF